MSCERRHLQRLGYHPGALVCAADLNDLLADEALRHAHHVAGLHRTWGVIAGLDVAVLGNEQEARVSPGAAYTCRGEVLALGETRELAHPPRPGIYDLVLAGSGTTSTCACPGLHGTARGAILRWVPAPPGTPRAPRLAEEIHLGEEVPLARLTVLPPLTIGGGTRLSPQVELHVRRPARTRRKVRLTSGHEPWGSEVDSDRSKIVRMPDAERKRTPAYHVWLENAAPAPAGLVGPFLDVVGSRESLELTVQLAWKASLSPAQQATLEEAARKWISTSTIRWIGIERLEV